MLQKFKYVVIYFFLMWGELLRTPREARKNFFEGEGELQSILRYYK